MPLTVWACACLRPVAVRSRSVLEHLPPYAEAPLPSTPDEVSMARRTRRVFLRDDLESRTLLTSVPALNSLPGAPASLYLDFVGDVIPQWLQYKDITIPAYDQDGDPTTFSD